MNKREWLVRKGLAKANSRGRFSTAAKEALRKAEADGVVFDTSAPVTARLLTVPEDIEPPVRDIGDELEGWTRGGFSFAFSNCRACGKNINYCKCSDGIVAPAIIEALPKGSPARIARR